MRKRLSLLAAILLLSGCTTNGQYDAGKTWTLVGVLAVGAVVASQEGGSSDSGQNCYIYLGPGETSGGTRVCD